MAKRQRGLRYRQRNGQWQFEVRVKEGHAAKSFPKSDFDSGLEWALEQRRRLRIGDVPTLNRKRLEQFTIDYLIEEYRKDCKIYPHKRKASYEIEDVILKAFQRANLCRKPLSQVTSADFKAYIDRRLLSGREPATVRRELNPIRTIFKIARKDWHIPVPKEIFSELELPKEGPGRKRFLSQEEHIKLFKAIEQCRTVKLRRLWASLVLAALSTGLRRGELLKLQWRDIDFKEKTLYLRPEITKTGKDRLLPLPLSLTIYLRAYWASISEGHRTSNSPLFHITPGALEQMFKHICELAGINTPETHRRDRLTFHSLRHTASTNFAYKPIELTVAENEYMLGHNDRSTNAGYRHIQQIEMVKQIRPKLEAAYTSAYLGKDTALSTAYSAATDAFHLGEPEIEVWKSNEKGEMVKVS
jgi:integrase